MANDFLSKPDLVIIDMNYFAIWQAWNWLLRLVCLCTYSFLSYCSQSQHVLPMTQTDRTDLECGTRQWPSIKTGTYQDRDQRLIPEWGLSK